MICLRAIKDVNVPKFLQDDLKLFNGIISDLFPMIKEETIDYGILEEAIHKCCLKDNLKDVDGMQNICYLFFSPYVVLLSHLKILPFLLHNRKALQSQEGWVICHPTRSIIQVSCLSSYINL